MQVSAFNEKVAKALLFLSAIVYENEKTFQRVLESEMKNWTHMKLNVSIKHSAASDFANLFEVKNKFYNLEKKFNFF